MKKILVLASLAVSLSFGIDISKSALYNPYSTAIGKAAEQGKAADLFIFKECKSVQDKVNGCSVFKFREDGGADQIVTYAHKKIIAFHKIYKSAYPPMETEWVLCVMSGFENKDNKARVECVDMAKAANTGKTEYILDKNGTIKEVESELNAMLKSISKTSFLRAFKAF